jgi:hypothetical protein
MFNLSDKLKLLAASGLFGLSFVGLIAVAVLYWSADRRADKLDVTLNGKDGKGGVTRDLADCRSTLGQQRDALASQNAAIEQLGLEAQERADAADKAIRQAQQEAKVYRAKAEKIARAKPGPDQCASARGLIVDALSTER